MKTGFVLLFSYFLLVPMFVLTLVFYQLFLHNQSKELAAMQANTVIAEVPQADAVALIETPTEPELAEVTLQARINALQEFLGKYKSPLTTYAEQMVRAADKYGLDYRLLPAIAMQESTLCQKAPINSYNCWGFGIYGGKVTRFEDFETAIDTVSRTLAREYHAKGLQEPAEIMTKYTPSNKGEWAENVSYVMGRISSPL